MEKMQVQISNEIRIQGPPRELAETVRKELTIPNPEYSKKQRMGLWTGRTDPELYFYYVDGLSLVIPCGAGKLLRPYLKAAEISQDLADHGPIPYPGSIPLYDYQEEAVQAMEKAGCGILQSPCGSGKGLPLHAKIYTPYGYTRNGDLKIGDEVCNTYGGISKVTGIYDRGKQPCYKVSFSDNTQVICDASHIWTVRNTKKYKADWEERSTSELFREELVDDCGRKTYEIPISQPVCFKNRRITIDPWLMGALLGDGSLSEAMIGFSNSETDIIEKVKSKVNMSLRHTGKYDYDIVDGGSLKYRLMDYGLFGTHSHEKFIPKDYIYNTVEVRTEILRGLIDTDGSVKNSEITITSTSEQLMKDCLEIVQSLGGTGKIAKRYTKYTYKGEVRAGKPSYRLSIKLYNIIPFSSKKHFAKYRPRTKYKSAYRRIESITIVAPQATRCITVDSKDHLYLTDGFVVTHNTQMGIALAAKLQRKTLWVTHTQDLLNQSYERAAQYFPKSILGKITGGKVAIGSHMTFATVQTLSKLDLQKYKYCWDLIVVDECHRVSGTPASAKMFYRILSSLAARYKYGLSATVHRSDGLIKSTFAVLGDVKYQVPEEAVAKKTMQVKVVRRDTGVKISRQCQDTDGTLVYSKLIPYLTGNRKRNQQIIQDLIANAEHFNLILSDRLEHLKQLREMLPEDLRAESTMIDGSMTSKKAKAERIQAIEDLRAGGKHYLFASFSLAKEGLDIPRLDRLYLTTPKKDYAVVTQSIGRIARTFDGKEEPICYDYVDAIGFCENQWKRRKTSYRKAGCIIE